MSTCATVHMCSALKHLEPSQIAQHALLASVTEYLRPSDSAI